jgi:SNF2 family DNA or RNA helicase
MEDRMLLFTQYLDRTGMQHKDYQYEGVRWCLNNELREDPPCNVRGGFIMDEMGLGKTILMIGTLYTNPLPNTLIVLPPVLIDQWDAQMYLTAGIKPLIYHGKNKKTITIEQLSQSPVVITSYGAITLSKKQRDDHLTTLLHKVQWSRIIFDEAHHLRNSNTSTCYSAKLLNSNVRWLVSGTPVQNSKSDFYTLCSALKLPASYYTEKDNLKHIAKYFILKRTKQQVGIHISDITLHTNNVQWTNPTEMMLSEEIHSQLAFSRVSPNKTGNFVEQFYKSDKGHVLQLMLKAKQSCIMPSLMKSSLHKLDHNDFNKYKEAFNHTSKLDSIIHSIIERKNNGAGKLIFCNYRKEIDEVADRLIRAGLTVAKFDGRTPFAKRQLILTQPNDALILQIQTGCEGLNLQQNYSEIYFVSPHWNPAVEDQAIARCHRIGQTKPVYVHRFEMDTFVKDDNQETNTMTIENYTTTVQQFKRDIANECVKQ